MSDDLEPLTTENSVREISDREIVVMMVLSVVVVAAVSVFFAGIRFGAGVLFGGVLALGNYKWLDHSTRALLTPDAITSTSILAFKYVLRYAMIGAVVFGVYYTGVLPVTAVLLGLGSFAFAVVIIGLRSIFKT